MKDLTRGVLVGIFNIVIFPLDNIFNFSGALNTSLTSVRLCKYGN